VTVSTVRTLGTMGTAWATLSQRSVPGVGASVTTMRGRAAFISSAIKAGSSSGLMAITMPAASPPQMVQCVSGRLGSTKAMTSRRPMPRRWNMFAAPVIRANHSACVHWKGWRKSSVRRKKLMAVRPGPLATPWRSRS